MRHNKNCSLICLLLIAGCVQAPPNDSLSLRPISASKLRDYKTGSVERECVRSSLETLQAIQSFTTGHLEDEKIKSLMLDKLTNPAIRKIRVADYDSWHKSHSLSTLAQQHLEGCLQLSGSQLKPPNKSLQYCFRETEPATLMSNYRHTGRPLPYAIDDANSKYPDIAGKMNLDQLGKRIYLLATNEEEFNLRESIFFDCLSNSTSFNK